MLLNRDVEDNRFGDVKYTCVVSVREGEEKNMRIESELLISRVLSLTIHILKRFQAEPREEHFLGILLRVEGNGKCFLFEHKSSECDVSEGVAR